MALFLYAGPDTNEKAKFAKTFAKKFLKTDMQALNESTFSKLQPKMGSSTTVFISDGFKLGANHGKFLETVKQKNVTLLFKDASPKAMKGYVAVGIDGKYVVVNNAAHGRQQRIIQVGSDNVKYEEKVESLKEEDVVASSDDKAPLDTSRKMTAPPEEAIVAAKDRRPRDPDAIEKLLALWLKDDRYERMQGKSVVITEEDTFAYEAIVVLDDVDHRYSFTIAGKPETTDVQGFYAMSILMCAANDPVRKKYVKFQQTDACGMRIVGAVEKWEGAGMFNDKAETYFCLGTQRQGGWEQGGPLPSGWIRSKVEPHTPNTETTYVDTTGFSFSVTGEQEGGKEGGRKLVVSAGYSESHQTRKTIPDFSVRNQSSGATSGWQFYYTAMDGANYWNHCYYRTGFGYAIRSLASLAKSTLHLNAEAVYEAPPDYTDSVDWTVHSRIHAARLESDGSVFHKDIKKTNGYHTRWTNFTLNMDEITVPERPTA